METSKKCFKKSGSSQKLDAIDGISCFDNTAFQMLAIFIKKCVKKFLAIIGKAKNHDKFS